MAKETRIRWTAEEQALVIEAAKALQAKGKKLLADERLAKAQLALPKNRRRPGNANLNAWLNKAVHGQIAPGQKKGAAGAIGAPVAGLGAGNLSQALVGAFAEVFKAMLADPGVQKALRQAVAR